MRRPRPDPFAPRRGPGERPTAPGAMALRRARATFTAPTEYFLQPSSDEIGPGPDLFPMNKPVQLQDMGDPEEIHTRKMAEDEGFVRHHYMRAVDEASRGDCEGAMEQMEKAHHYFGAAQAHSSSGARHGTLTLVATNIDKAKAFVRKYCKVTKRGR